MYMHITNLEEFKKILDKGAKKYEDMNGKTGGSIIDIEDTTHYIEVNDDILSVTMGPEDIGFSFDIPSDLITEDIIKIAIKKMNKIKTMLESLK